jgi:membrane protein implicated in regulation of membrane protease activity
MRALVTSLIFFCLLALAPLVYVALLSRRKKSSTQPLALVGRVATVERDLNPEGFVNVCGELWPARMHDGATPVQRGARVRIVGARDHLLEVEPHG